MSDEKSHKDVSELSAERDRHCPEDPEKVQSESSDKVPSEVGACDLDGPAEEKIFNNIKKSQIDKREYRGVILKNGLRVMLISDENTNRSAVCLDVNVGSWSDPPELPGLAHYLEHMLFLGTEKVRLKIATRKILMIIVINRFFISSNLRLPVSGTERLLRFHFQAQRHQERLHLADQYELLLRHRSRSSGTSSGPIRAVLHLANIRCEVHGERAKQHSVRV